jgi:hypothetical protein
MRSTEYADFHGFGQTSFQLILRKSANGANAISDIDGKAAMGSGERAGKTSEFQWS